MLSEKDKSIIGYLRKNSRSSLTELSKKTSIPISTLYNKLIAFRGNIIRKHTALLDFKALGFHTQILVFIKCPRLNTEDIQLSLVKSEHINSVFKLHDEFQFLVEGVFEHVADADDYLETLEQKYPGIERKVFYITKEIQRERFLA